MDNFEASQLPQKQEFFEITKCWECGNINFCSEYIICCTGTQMHFCEKCEKEFVNIKDKKN